MARVCSECYRGAHKHTRAELVKEMTGTPPYSLSLSLPLPLYFFLRSLLLLPPTISLILPQKQFSLIFAAKNSSVSLSCRKSMYFLFLPQTRAVLRDRSSRSHVYKGFDARLATEISYPSTVRMTSTRTVLERQGRVGIDKRVYARYIPHTLGPHIPHTLYWNGTVGDGLIH